MKLKIILTVLVLLFSINNVFAEILDEGEFTEYSFDSKDVYTSFAGISVTKPVDALYFKNSENYQSGLQYIYCDMTPADFAGDLEATYDSYYETITLKDGATPVSDGMIGYYKKSDGDYRIWLWFDLSTWSYTGSGVKQFTITGHNQDHYQCGGMRDGAIDSYTIYSVAFANIANYYRTDTYTIDTVYNFKNEFYTEMIGNMKSVYYDKTVLGFATSSKIKITDSLDTILLNESSFNTNDINVSYYTENIPFKLECTNYEETYFLEHLEFESTFDYTSCRIDIDDITIGENIEASYFNINDLRYNPLKYGNVDYADCNINLQIIADRGYYEELIYQDLITDETDNIFYYSSTDLSNGVYYAQINKELGSLSDYAVRTTFIISEPANYSIIVNPNNVYVGDNINIIYKSLNQSTISIYDNSSTLIKTYLNIQNEGQKIFQIPPDNEYDNEYPNWYVYLNDTGNASNNLQYMFTVNWKVYIEPVPTPEPIEPYYNVTIEENIGEIKDGINPIKELIFGISTIFVDNPDYNKDNVVDVDEISTWLNSLISIAIIIFIYILYTVYKRG